MAILEHRIKVVAPVVEVRSFHLNFDSRLLGAESIGRDNACVRSIEGMRMGERRKEEKDGTDSLGCAWDRWMETR